IVEYVEPNYIYYAASRDLSVMGSAFPDDEFFVQQWGLHNVDSDADIDAPEAWELTQGSRDVLVDIIDTGVDYTHPDLAENIFTNPGESGTYFDKDGALHYKATDGIDNDLNGYVDDLHGYDFANKDGDPIDDHDHGTFVAGIIGAVGDNQIGVSGINWKVSLLPVKFLSSNGSGTLADAILAIQYATLMGAKILNNSWGGGGFSDALLEAIEATRDAGALFVAAAGNEGSDIDSKPIFPAGYGVENELVVTSTNNLDVLNPFANFGSTVDVAAPSNAISTAVSGRYINMTGTSVSTAFGSGVAALLAAREPNFTGIELKRRLRETVDKLPTLEGKIGTGGRINAFRALTNESNP
ncbi:MAG TPA: S8 family peptidase, partial [Bdellovibrionota bacterium]|nr:S8 family peptidase [Bdellovibrionota bacterium]